VQFIAHKPPDFLKIAPPKTGSGSRPDGAPVRWPHEIYKTAATASFPSLTAISFAVSPSQSRMLPSAPHMRSCCAAPVLSWIAAFISAVTPCSVEAFKGAHLDCQDFHGNTPLMRAATYGDVEMLHLLLDAGADINSATEHGVTALIKAAIHDRADAAQALLRRGADGNLQDSDGLTAKDIAAKLGNKAVTAVL